MDTVGMVESRKRWLVKLPDNVLLNRDYVKDNPFFAFSTTYLDKAPYYFSLGQHEQADRALSTIVYNLLYDTAKQVSSQEQAVVYRALFDNTAVEVVAFYQRSASVSCTAVSRTNLFNYLYVYLTTAQEAGFVDRLQNTAVQIVEATPQLVSGQLSVHAQAQPYQNLMHMDAGRGWAGGRGEAAHCLIIEDDWGLNNPALPLYVQHDEQVPVHPPDTLFDGWLAGLGKWGSATTHGTKTLGVLVGQPTGIVPNLVIRRLVSGQVPEQVHIVNGVVVHEAGAFMGHAQHPEAALLKAIVQAQKGDILLVEYEWENSNLPLPLEAIEPSWSLMKAATACFGITIIEPLGNRTDTSTTHTRNLDLTSVGPRLVNNDSGAILVGAATTEGAGFRNQRNYSLLAFSQQRVCYAPVPVASILPAPDNLFDQTSAAAAIIAGVACMVQSIHRTAFPAGTGLTPQQLRALLCNPTNGLTQPVKNEAGVTVGSIPDVAKIVAALGIPHP